MEMLSANLEIDSLLISGVIFHHNVSLVGGFNPSEKYDRQIGNLPQG